MKDLIDACQSVVNVVEILGATNCRLLLLRTRDGSVWLSILRCAGVAGVSAGRPAVNKI